MNQNKERKKGKNKWTVQQKNVFIFINKCLLFKLNFCKIVQLKMHTNQIIHTLKKYLDDDNVSTVH